MSIVFRKEGGSERTRIKNIVKRSSKQQQKSEGISASLVLLLICEI